MLSMNCRWLGVMVLLTAVAATARAETTGADTSFTDTPLADTYMARFDQARWQVQRSPLQCRLTQTVPHFGKAVFEALGGGGQRFVLHAQQNPFAGGPAALIAAAPDWNPSRRPVALGKVDLAAGDRPLQLGDGETAQLLDSLRNGLVPTLTGPLQGEAGRTASVALSPVDFRPAYRRFNACIGKLLPVTFDDVKHTVVKFAHDSTGLSAAARQKLNELVRYAAADPAVTRFEVRAVSSDRQLLLDNFELARKRGRKVTAYLRKHGVAAKTIAMTYHGERAAGRRYVSIRLERHKRAH